MNNDKPCCSVDSIPVGAASAHWTLRADNHNHHHGRVQLSKSPLYLELKWKQSKGAKISRVGIFCLDLQKLLAGRYIRPEPADIDATAEVRLRIVRTDSNHFYVQWKSDEPRLPLDDGR
jgi:hypothetical protein